MNAGKQYIHIVTNYTNKILHFAIYQDMTVHIIYIYVAENEQILKNMFAERYYGSLNPGKSMRLEAESPKAEILRCAGNFEITGVTLKHPDFQEHLIILVANGKTQKITLPD